MRYVLLVSALFCAGSCLSVVPPLIKKDTLAPDLSGAKLLFCSVCGHSAGGVKGYLQSFPWYLEKIIRDALAFLSQMYIILIDPGWDPAAVGGFFPGKSGYEKSDLKAYLDTLGDLGKKIEERIFCVAMEFTYQQDENTKVWTISPPWIKDALMAVAASGNIVMLVDSDRNFTGTQLANLYGDLRAVTALKGNIQYFIAPYPAAEGIWCGASVYDSKLQAIVSRRAGSARETGTALDEILAKPETIEQRSKIPMRGPSGNRDVWKVLLDIGKEQVEDATGKMVLLTKDFFVKAALPYMFVSNDPANKKYPLLEYTLDTQDKTKWKLVPKLSLSEYWKRYLEKDPLADALKNFSASLSALGAPLKHA